jgi:hypothetical protein
MISFSSELNLATPPIFIVNPQNSVSWASDERHADPDDRSEHGADHAHRARGDSCQQHARFGDLNTRLGETNVRIGELRSHMDTRFEEVKDLWRSELHRVEEVLDARLKHSEER